MAPQKPSCETLTSDGDCCQFAYLILRFCELVTEESNSGTEALV